MAQQCTHRGMTILELMVVVAIISALVALAVPAISTYSEPLKQRAAIRRVVDTFSFGRVQAKRLNRAMLVELSGFDKQTPHGVIELLQGIGGNCALLAERRDGGEDVFSRLRRVPFGRTIRTGYQGDVQPNVGLYDWQHNDGVRSTNLLRLCLSPDGSIHRILGATAVPLSGKIVLNLQAFDEALGGLAPRGGANRIEIRFSGSVHHAK